MLSNTVPRTNADEPLVFISSADWMPRNLDRRVELLVPVDDDACRTRLIKILNDCFRDNTQARKLNADGSYTRLAPVGKDKPFRAQQAFYDQSVEANRRAKKSAGIVFEPQRPSHTA